MTRDARLELSRAGVSREWRELRTAIRSETGLPARSVVWVVALGGLAVGLELARRWCRHSEGRRRR